MHESDIPQFTVGGSVDPKRPCVLQFLSSLVGPTKTRGRHSAWPTQIDPLIASCIHTVNDRWGCDHVPGAVLCKRCSVKVFKIATTAYDTNIDSLGLTNEQRVILYHLVVAESVPTVSMAPKEMMDPHKAAQWYAALALLHAMPDGLETWFNVILSAFLRRTQELGAPKVRRRCPYSIGPDRRITAPRPAPRPSLLLPWPLLADDDPAWDEFSSNERLTAPYPSEPQAA